MSFKIELIEVEFLPKLPEKGFLYVSDRFNVATHICPCGCETKIITPLGACEWSLSRKKGRPTLYPSIGNWQIPCQSHYWIINGEIKWSYQWSDEQIKRGRAKEQVRREAYYQKRKPTKVKMFCKRLKSFFSKK